MCFPYPDYDPHTSRGQNIRLVICEDRSDEYYINLWIQVEDRYMFVINKLHTIHYWEKERKERCTLDICLSLTNYIQHIIEKKKERRDVH